MSEIQKQCECHGAKSGELVTVPLAALEHAGEREDRKHKRNFVLILVLIFALLFSNIAWVIYDKQYQDIVTTETVDVDGSDGGNAFGVIGNENEVNYGESDSNTNN